VVLEHSTTSFSSTFASSTPNVGKSHLGLDFNQNQQPQSSISTAIPWFGGRQRILEFRMLDFGGNVATETKVRHMSDAWT
jgi:hypothetical protein